MRRAEIGRAAVRGRWRTVLHGGAKNPSVGRDETTACSVGVRHEARDVIAVASCDVPTHLETAACYECSECVPSDGHRGAERNPVTLRPVSIDLRVVDLAREHRRAANLAKT